MKGKAACTFRLWLVVAVALAVCGAAPASRSIPLAAQGRPGAEIAIQAAGRGNPWLSYRDGRALPADYSGDPDLARALLAGLAQPLTLAAGDFDRDGVPDLVAGYALDGGGILALHRGNVDALFPNAPAAQSRRAEGAFSDLPFLSPALLFPAPAAPDFLAAGDLDNDGRLDLVAAARGAPLLYLLPGDGAGGLGVAQAVALPGAVTAMAAGDVNRRDGLVDLAVAVNGPDGPRLLVFEGPEGALRREPEALDLPAEAAGLALGPLDGDYPIDLAVAAGRQLIVVHGRDRRLSLGARARAGVAPATLDVYALPNAAAGLAAGNLALDAPGTYRQELGILAVDGTVHVVDPAGGAELGRWAASPGARRLVAANSSALPADDLLVIDPVEERLGILPGLRTPAPPPAASLPAELDAAGAPAAVLPMRLNADALDDLVILVAGAGAPAVVETAPLLALTVNDAGDESDECARGDGICAATEWQGDPQVCTAVAGCTLRAALQEADASAGWDYVGFGLPGAGPHTLQVATYLDANYPLTLDGTSQPGYAGSPVIEIRGSDTVNLYLSGGDTVVRGLAFTGAAVHGLQVDNFYGWNGGNTILEGNYIGLRPGGETCGGNGQLGLGIENVPNNRVGGTTGEARNVLSCNGGHGIQMGPSTAVTLNRVTGNYLGTDAGGTLDRGNGDSGVVIADGSNNDVGGTTAAERNVC